MDEFQIYILKILHSGSLSEVDDVRQVEPNYLEEITSIKNKIKNGEEYGIKKEP